MPIAEERRRIAVASEEYDVEHEPVTEDGSMDGSTAAAVLGVAPGATRAELRRAFRARAKLAHPDSGLAAGSDDAFVTLRTAFEQLDAAAPDHPRPEFAAAESAFAHPASGRPTSGLSPSGPSAFARRAAARPAVARSAWWGQAPGTATIDLTDSGPGSSGARGPAPRVVQSHHPMSSTAPTATPATGTATPATGASGQRFAVCLEAELARHR